ncbi:MAG: hypothetical protein EOP11_18985 [Proteobacteria bacterium]|nr:MAG: hypothetical protein EOP11_18985 [Pseudomonadota bacterium]
MKFLLIALLVISTPAYAKRRKHSAEPKKGDWSACRVSADCEKAEAICGGSVALNKTHIEEYTSMKDSAEAPALDCPPPATEEEADAEGTSEVSCVKKRCQLVLPKAPKAKKAEASKES